MNEKHLGLRRIRVIVAAFVILSLPSLQQVSAVAQEKGKAPAGDRVAQLYAGAKKEGTVVVWGPTDIIIFQKAQQVFGKRYPGIKIDYFESLPDPLVQRMITEHQAGKPSSVDIIHSGSLRALRPLIDRDMLASDPVWGKEFKLDALYLNNRLVGIYNLSLPISYNTKLIGAKDAPKSWEDLLDSKWKGRKLIVEARLVPVAMLGTEWGVSKALEFTRTLLAQDPIIVQGGTTVANALAGGQAPVAIGTYGFSVNMLKKAGATVEWVPVSPLPILTGSFGIVKNAPHPNSARLFAGWMGGPEGQKILYEATGQAVLVGRNASGLVAERIKTAQPKIILENENNFAAIVDVQRELGKLLGALR